MVFLTKIGQVFVCKHENLGLLSNFSPKIPLLGRKNIKICPVQRGIKFENLFLFTRGCSYRVLNSFQRICICVGSFLWLKVIFRKETLGPCSSSWTLPGSIQEFFVNQNTNYKHELVIILTKLSRDQWFTVQPYLTKDALHTHCR